MLQRIFDQLKTFWQKQTNTQRLILGVLVTVFVVILVVLVNWATKTTYGVAFSGLDDTDAGQIVSQLESQNIPYQLRGTGTIMVPSDQVYEVRLMMANEGLPEGDNVGYELFSSNTLGMTEFTQRVNYQRALEGELERTILSMDAVNAVRVHIVTPEKSLLSSEQAPTTASITIEEKVGETLDASQVRALSYLVANAVEGLDPENVTVVDTYGNLLASGAGDEGIAGGLTQVDNRRAAEISVANDIQTRVRSLLDTTLGPNRSVVQVNVSLDWTEKQVTSELYDPDTTALYSSQSLQETYSTDGTTVGGVPGATSNLPDTQTDTTTTDQSNLVYLRTEDTNNYSISKTESYETIYPGELNQVSLSVLVDGVTDAEQLAKLEEAISAAAGINADRGDVISVQSLDFDHTYTDELQAEMAAEQSNNNLMVGIQIGAAVLLAALLFWYVQRLLKNLRLASVEVWEPVMKPAYQFGEPAISQDEYIPSALPIAEIEEEEEEIEEFLPPVPDLSKLVEAKAQVQTAEEEQMQRVVSRIADENPASIAEIIQLWLNEDREDRG